MAFLPCISYIIREKLTLFYCKGSDYLSKQSNQRYRKELDLNHKERSKDSSRDCVTNRDSSPMKDASREGYGDGDPTGAPDPTKKQI